MLSLFYDGRLTTRWVICSRLIDVFETIFVSLSEQTGPIGAWKICPIMGGIGYATTVITFLMNIYYIVILAWSLYFMFMSFSTVLSWAHCQNTWNTKNCFLPDLFPING